MRRLAAALLGLTLGVLGSHSAFSQGAGSQQITCNKVSFASAVATATTGQVVPLVAGQTVSICGYVASSVAASTVQLVYGTGANCGTGTTPINSPVFIGASVPAVLHSAFAFFSAPTGNAICATIGGTGPVNITVSYTQF